LWRANAHSPAQTLRGTDGLTVEEHIGNGHLQWDARFLL
jgi:hypothetical protein